MPRPILRAFGRSPGELSGAVMAAALAASAAWATEPAVERAALSGRVGASVIAELRAGGRPRVIIAFRLPDALASPRARALDAPGTETTIRSRGDAVVRRASQGAFALRHQYRAINALVGEIDADALATVLDDPDVLRVDPDLAIHATLAEAVPLVRLDVVHALGWTGAGVTVAVIDTGIDTDHPDLADDLVAEQCFCFACPCPGGANVASGPGSAEDDHGHGTHVAGIITSGGVVAPPGTAPDAGIVAIKVLNAAGGGFLSDELAALDWIISTRPDVSIVNMSLGTDGVFNRDCDDLFASSIAEATAANTLRARGTLVFAASGNGGHGNGMGLPACLKNIVSVGAVYDADVGPLAFGICSESSTQADQVTCFTDSNQTTDVFAPGGPTTSSGMGGGVQTLFGTSMATPVAAGCAATLRQAHPSWTSDQIEFALESSPVRVTDATNGLAFPRIDCAAALAFSCGDGITDPGEECDDGNLTPCDGCSGSCKMEVGYVCGDGIVNEACGERCDDANLDDGDGCSRACQLVSPKRDHFLCHRARTASSPPWVPTTAMLADFEEAGDFDLRKPRALCAPADVDDDGILNPDVVLAQYRIKAGPNVPPHRPLQENVVNKFGEIFMDTTRAYSLLVPTAVDPTGPVEPPDDASHVLDHYKCYSHKLRTGFAEDEGIWMRGQQVTITDPFTGAPNRYELIKPTRLCHPVAKDGTPVRYPYDRLNCYKIRLLAGQSSARPTVDLHGDNDVGPARFSVGRESEVCLAPERGCSSFLYFGTPPDAQRGCGGCPCEDCVCAFDAFCCFGEWDQRCVEECDRFCHQTCR